MMDSWLVGLGGAAGAGMRYIVSKALIPAQTGSANWIGTFPLSTFAVNMAGSFALAVLYAVVDRHSARGARARLALGTGFMGAFTTFSAFSMETVSLVQHGYLSMAAGYVCVSFIGGIGCTAAGYLAGKRLAEARGSSGTNRGARR